MQSHCFSDLPITMEIVFLSFPAPPAGSPRAGKRRGGRGYELPSSASGRVAAPRRSRERAGFAPLPVKTVWGGAEGVKRERENPAEEGRSLSVSGGAARCPPPPSAEGEGPVPVHGRGAAGSGRWAEAPAAPRLARLAAVWGCACL